MEFSTELGEVECLSYEEALHAVFTTNSPLNLIGGVMVERELIGNTLFRDDLFIGEDFWFIYENLIKGSGAVFLKPKWYFCRIHANNSSWNYGYDGFWTRFYRRMLVWEQETEFGRNEYANIQKRQAFGIFLDCLKRNSRYSTDNSAMRETVKQYRKILFPALSQGQKIKYYLAVYVPSIYLVLVQMKQRLQKTMKLL